MDKVSKTAIILIIIAVAIVLFPLFAFPSAEFRGTDDVGSDMVAEVIGGEHEPWFEAPIERILGGKLPGEIETLLFCVQTGIGVGILAFCFGYLVARKKYGGGADDAERRKEDKGTSA